MFSDKSTSILTSFATSEMTVTVNPYFRCLLVGQTIFGYGYVRRSLFTCGKQYGFSTRG